MDGQRFDRWARSIAAASSRRGLLKGLAGAVAAGLFAAREAEAAGRSCRRQPDGAPCGECGVCRNETCVANASSCGGCLRCDPRTLTCRPDDDRCSACERCERDGGGYRCKRFTCAADERCCNHRCLAKRYCCKNADCGDCGKCENRQCKNDPARLGQKCGNGGCEVCTSRGCDKQIDNAGCFDVNGICCDGVCCAPDQTCCGRTCCAGVCLPGDFCCGSGSGFTAAGTDLCCPFGPPCGEGDAARCCEENEQCCEASGVCCGADRECCAEGCCAAGDVCCGDACCPAEQCCGNGCCEGGTVCCEGVCKDSCDNPCGAPGLQPCYYSNGFACCADDAPCCPGNVDKCALTDGGSCCGIDTFACGDVCCNVAEFQICGGPPGVATHCCKFLDVACITAP